MLNLDEGTKAEGSLQSSCWKQSRSIPNHVHEEEQQEWIVSVWNMENITSNREAEYFSQKMTVCVSDKETNERERKWEDGERKADFIQISVLTQRWNSLKLVRTVRRRDIVNPTVSQNDQSKLSDTCLECSVSEHADLDHRWPIIHCCMWAELGRIQADVCVLTHPSSHTVVDFKWITTQPDKSELSPVQTQSIEDKTLTDGASAPPPPPPPPPPLFSQLYSQWIVCFLSSGS